MNIHNLKLFTISTFNKFKLKDSEPKKIGGLLPFADEKEALFKFIVKCEYECGFFDKEETGKQLDYCIQQIENRFPNLSVSDNEHAKRLYDFKEKIKDINCCIDEYHSPYEIRELLDRNPIEEYIH